MRIAQIAPLAEAVPPRLYGGTERVIGYLVEALVQAGHEVTLFASGDSRIAAELVPCCHRALRLDPSVSDPAPYQTLQLERVRQRMQNFDVLHVHLDHQHFPLLRPIRDRVVTTLHGRLDLPDLQPVFREFRDMPVVSISDDQRSPLPFARWAATVYHGLPRDLYPFSAEPRGGYLAFLGRITPDKRPDRAIEIARRAGMPLKIAAKIDRTDRSYFEERIRPLLESPLVEFVGEVTDAQKAEFLGHARALLFPVDWPEPFGLAMIEAMACGTPVIAWRRGSVPEVVDPGVTGAVVDGIAEAVEAVRRAGDFDRTAVRRRFEERFTADRMARDYLNVYRALGAEGEALRMVPRGPTNLEAHHDPSFAND